jgi:hypothetical protein
MELRICIPEQLDIFRKNSNLIAGPDGPKNPFVTFKVIDENLCGLLLNVRAKKWGRVRSAVAEPSLPPFNLLSSLH